MGIGDDVTVSFDDKASAMSIIVSNCDDGRVGFGKDAVGSVGCEGFGDRRASLELGGDTAVGEGGEEQCGKDCGFHGVCGEK